MTQTKNPFLDQMAEAMTSAAGFTQGLWHEAETFFKLQAEKILTDMDLVRREELDVVRDMAVKAREENESLKKRLESLEAAVKAKKPNSN
jgi:BMFP domain-containing protein YqiC